MNEFDAQWKGAYTALNDALDGAQRQKETMLILNEALKANNAELYAIGSTFTLDQEGIVIRRGFWIEVLRATLRFIHDNPIYKGD